MYVAYTVLYVVATTTVICQYILVHERNDGTQFSPFKFRAYWLDNREVSSVIYCVRGFKIRRCLSQNRFGKPPLPALSLSQNKGGMPVAVLDGNWLMRRVLEVHVLKSLTFLLSLVCFGILQQSSSAAYPHI